MNILLHRPAGLGYVQLYSDLWFHGLGIQLAKDPDVGKIIVHPWLSPWMAMGRNVALSLMLDRGFDYCLMVDPDMVPDLYVGTSPQARRFVSSSLAWLKEHPCGIVAAPYTGPRPERRVHIWRAHGTAALRVTHAELKQALQEPHMEHIPASGAGLLLIDRQAAERIPPPWFEDTYETEHHTKLKEGFDVAFGNKAQQHEVPLWCNWYSFAGHVQMAVLGCPGLQARTAENLIPTFLDTSESDHVVETKEQRPVGGAVGSPA